MDENTAASYPEKEDKGPEIDSLIGYRNHKRHNDSDINNELSLYFIANYLEFGSLLCVNEYSTA